MPLRNGTKLGYPYELAIKSLRPLCDEVVVLVDPTSEDDTMARVHALSPDRIVESVWDMNNHNGHTNCEITVQTRKLCDAASGDWIVSLQADEILHEKDSAYLREVIERSEAEGVTGNAIERLYFYGALDRYRQDWTQWLVRIFKRGCWKPDVDGAMKFEPIGDQRVGAVTPFLYHYSRVGNPQVIAERVRNLDGFFHAPDKILPGQIAPYDFSKLRKLDTYVADAQLEIDTNASLVPFPIDGHPHGVRELFG
jgi:hypothetical protein